MKTDPVPNPGPSIALESGALTAAFAGAHLTRARVAATLSALTLLTAAILIGACAAGNQRADQNTRKSRDEQDCMIGTGRIGDGSQPRPQSRGFRRTRELCASRAMAVVATLHDLNAAAEYADAVLLLKDGHAIAYGSPEQVLTADNLREVYETEVYVGRNPATGAIAILAAPGNRT